MFDASCLIDINDNLRLGQNRCIIDHYYGIAAPRLVSAQGLVLVPICNCSGARINPNAVVWNGVALGAIVGGSDLVSGDLEPVQVSARTPEQP
jgi:hypothetical protein